MADASPPERTRGFPLITVAASVATLFVFMGLMVLAYRSPDYLEQPKPGATDAASAPPALNELKARNHAAIDGVGAKMPLRNAHDHLLITLKTPADTLPFPTPEPAVPSVPKKGEKEKSP